MANNLPDEIISEILSPALKVSDFEFSDSSENSPFVRYSESSSAYLLVSKAWLRVATPLLYHVVVLRSKGQAHALDSALGKNTELGRFIKKLRVEGGYGGSMRKIISLAPNVTDLFISLNIWSADNVSGLCRALPSMNPTRVVLYDLPYRRRGTFNKNSQLLLDTLQQSIKQWKNLAVFESPYLNYYNSSAAPNMIASALSEAPNLKVLVIPASSFHGTDPSEHLRMIAKNPALQSIKFKQRPGSEVPQDYYLHPQVRHPSLRGLIKIPDDDAIIFAPNSEPAAKDIQFSTASVTEDIWKRVFYFAMALDLENTTWRPTPGCRLGTALVSKTFAKLALPYINENLFFRTPWKLDAFEKELAANFTLGPQVRTVYLQMHSHHTLPRILPEINLVNLIGVDPLIISPKVFNDVGKFCGSTLVRLEGLQITKGSKLEKASLFSHFRRIRSLSVAFQAPFAVSPASSIPSNALATLERLTLSAFHESLITVLSHMDLLALRHAAFPAAHAGLDTFFAKHGDKLRTLTISAEGVRRNKVFDLCTVMVDLTVRCESIPDPGSFTSASNHMALETISFMTGGFRQRGVERKWGTFFKTLNVSTFPALRQISVPCINWPTTEHDISKSLWVKWAEALLDSNVKLTDGNGVGWRRRLKK